MPTAKIRGRVFPGNEQKAEEATNHASRRGVRLSATAFHEHRQASVPPPKAPGDRLQKLRLFPRGQQVFPEICEEAKEQDHQSGSRKWSQERLEIRAVADRVIRVRRA
jgi:hypothetical protein